MWKRERMMVDVISLQHKSNHNNNDSSIATVTKQQQTLPPTQPLLQNRLFYPFQGIHDDQNNFYAGNQYNQYGDLTINKNKRKSSLSAINPSELKRHKSLPPPPQPPQQHSTVKATTNYTFTSKPYDLMDNLMYYY